MMRNTIRTAAGVVAVLVMIGPALAAGNPCGEPSNRLYMIDRINAMRARKNLIVKIIDMTEAQTLGAYNPDNDDVKCRVKVDWSNGDRGDWRLYYEYTNSVESLWVMPPIRHCNG
jgi:hypothetical protein